MFIKRIKFLVIPYLLSILIGMAFLGLMRIAIDMYLEIQFNVVIWQFWLPGIIAFVLWLLILRDRIRVLEIPNKRDNGYFNTHSVVVLAVALPVCLSQFFLERTVSVNSKIQNVLEIKPENKLENYQIKTINWYDQSIHIIPTAEISGRYNQNLDYYCYVVAPMFYSGDTMVWAGKRYNTSLKTSDSDETKQSAWIALQENSLNDFPQEIREEGLYLFLVPESASKKQYLKAIHKNYLLKDKTHVIYEFSDTYDRSEAHVFFIWIISLILLAVIMLAVFAYYFPPNKALLNKYRKGLDISSVDDLELREFLLLKSSAKGSAIILYLNVMVMLYMVAINISAFSPHADDLLQLGALRDKEVWNGDYWRLITYQFLHAGIIHLVNNLVLITLFGALIESVMNTWKYVGMYLFTGVVAGIGSLYLNENTVAVGASGALFGIFGWFVTTSVVFKNKLETSAYLPLIIIMAAVNLLFGFIMPNVDNAGHIFGFIGGIIAGVLFVPKSVSSKV